MSEPTPPAPMNAPTEDHRRLESFAGTFRAQVKLWMGPGDPSVLTGVMVNELDLNGLFLVQTYTGDGDDGPFGKFAGRGFWGYNSINGRWEGVWIDNASPMMQTESGTLDASGRVWTMTGELPNPSTGDTMTKRTVITLVDDDHHMMETYFGGPQGESKAMEITYERTG